MQVPRLEPTIRTMFTLIAGMKSMAKTELTKFNTSRCRRCSAKFLCSTGGISLARARPPDNAMEYAAQANREAWFRTHVGRTRLEDAIINNFLIAGSLHCYFSSDSRAGAKFQMES